MTQGHFTRVTLPRLTRPNLVARLYMLFTAMSTAGVAWGVTDSAIGRIMSTGGVTPHIVMAVMLLATIGGLADVVLNDVAMTQDKRRDWLADFAAWLQGHNMQRCFLIGGCYLILTFAGIGSPVTGTFWLLAYYVQMTFCSGLLGWSLRALMLATVKGGHNAPA